MRFEPRHINFDEFTLHVRAIFSRLAARGEPLLVEHEGKVYRLEPADPPSTYDPRAALAGMRAAAGSWKDIDPERSKELIYCAREEGTRPNDQPRATWLMLTGSSTPCMECLPRSKRSKTTAKTA